MRELVGYFDPVGFDNPTGAPIWDGLPRSAWRSYLDFGCGCGRSARRLMQQTPVPERYVGVDIHRGMVQWCQDNLTPLAPAFAFVHHDVYSPGLNPHRSRPWAAPLPVEDGSFTIVEATSVFTHLVESQAEFYLDEIRRVLAPEGILIATWFLFDKVGFPFMQDNQNALYINDRDPTNAVVFDRGWLHAALAERGLLITRVEPPSIQGYHWRLWLAPARPGLEAVAIPPDQAPPGRRPPPLLRVGAERIGLDPAAAEGDVHRSQRQPLPPPDPIAAELAAAKEYIASLEAARNATAGETALQRGAPDSHDLAPGLGHQPRDLGWRLKRRLRRQLGQPWKRIGPALRDPPSSKSDISPGWGYGDGSGRHTAPMLGHEDIRRRIQDLAPWYQNIELAEGIWTKDLEGDRDIFSTADIPGPLWRLILRDLPDLTGKRVLDIGCNAGYMSFACKRLGAAYVLGVDSNLGASTSFIAQAEFCREVFGLDVEFREQPFFTLAPEQPFDVVLFCGVLYHLEDYATALDRVAALAVPGEGVVVLETASEPVTLTLPGPADYHGDTSTFFVPSVPVLLELLRERDFAVEVVRDLGTRALTFMRPPAQPGAT
jgi:SAM-dependent methyltransferase